MTGLPGTKPASYYERTFIDGTPMYRSAEDEQNENEAAVIIGKAWRCELHAYGPLSPIDFYATRDGHLIGHVEIKARSHTAGTYPTVFLNVRKWLALTLAQAGMGIPAMFVVRFTDELRSIALNDIDARAHAIGGCRGIVKAASDVEPVIHVPVHAMEWLA